MTIATVRALPRLREPGAGELDKLVTIRRRADYPAPDMGLDSTFVGTVKRWAKLEPVGTAVYLDGVQSDHAITHRLTLYWLEGVTREHEVVCRARVYAIRRVTDLNGGGVFTVLEVEELGDVS